MDNLEWVFVLAVNFNFYRMKQFLIYGLCISFLCACAKDKVNDNVVLECFDEVSFSQQIEPLMNQSCVGCHSSSSQSGGYNFEGYINIANQANQILGAMQADGFQLMPIGGPPLSDSLIKHFQCWIEQGTLDN